MSPAMIRTSGRCSSIAAVTCAIIEETFSLQIVVTVGRDDDSPDPDILDIEAEGPSIAVNFGYVDVDYGDEPDF